MRCTGLSGMCCPGRPPAAKLGAARSTRPTVATRGESCRSWRCASGPARPGTASSRCPAFMRPCWIWALPRWGCWTTPWAPGGPAISARLPIPAQQNTTSVRHTRGVAARRCPRPPIIRVMSYGQVARKPPQRIAAADVRGVGFSKPRFGKRGYDETEVDDFLRLIADTLARVPAGSRVTADEVHEVAFRKPRLGSRGYDEDQVDEFLDLIEAELRWRESPDGQHELQAEAAASTGAARSVRAVALALLVDRGRLLTSELPDPTTGRTVYRPPGGEVAFGERGHETVLRTFRDEFGAGLADIRPLATL